jgi:hypothetical protein
MDTWTKASPNFFGNTANEETWGNGTIVELGQFL